MTSSVFDQITFKKIGKVVYYNVIHTYMHVFDLNILDMLDVKKVILRHIFRGLFPFLCDEYITVGIDQSQEKKSSRVLLIHLGRPLSFLTVCKGDYKGLSTTLMLDLFDISSFRKDPSNPPKRNLILDLSNERKPLQQRLLYNSAGPDTTALSKLPLRK